MTSGEKQELALLLGQVIGKQDEMHNDIKEFKNDTHDSIEEVNTHLKESNGRLAEVEHQMMTWRARFLTAFALVLFSAPFLVEPSRTFIVNIVT